MGVCDVPVISSVCDAVGEGAASLVAAPFDWLAQAMGAAAGWLFEAVWSVFDTTTLVDVTKPGYIAVYNLLFGIAVFVMLIFFCLQLITGLIRRDPTALTRAALGLAKSLSESGLLSEIVVERLARRVPNVVMALQLIGTEQKCAFAARRLKTLDPRYYATLYAAQLEMLYYFFEPFLSELIKKVQLGFYKDFDAIYKDLKGKEHV